MAIGFARDIRPYFTACFRAHMIEFGGFDLWAADQVQGLWQPIFDRVKSGSMPPGPGSDPPPCPEGGWDELTRAQFLADFGTWKAGNFEP